jgi:hypothetical protein
MTKSTAISQNYLQIPYKLSVPEDLVRRLAEHRVKVLAGRDDDAVW